MLARHSSFLPFHLYKYSYANALATTQPRLRDLMAESMSYPATQHFLPTQYYQPPHHHSHVHVVAAPPRPEATQRKRPKYTRSKTGCLTCRVKKIKCDETKPNCMRCTHGQRDCTWPEGVPARKKSASRKESADGRPSTAGSSGLSESSTPPTRDHTPPRRVPDELGLPPLVSRRHTEPYLQLHPMASESEPARRLTIDRGTAASNYQSMHQTPANTNVMNMIPEISSYASSQPRYDGYSSMHNSSRSGQNAPMANGVRTMGHHQSIGQWHSPPMVVPVEPIQPFYHSMHERNLVGHPSHNEQHARYQ